MERTTGQHDDPTSPSRARPGRRRRRAIAITAVGLIAGLGAAGTALADPGTVEGTPCSAQTRACVDLAANKAWLIKDGEVTDGPIAISHGGKGKETPTGEFSVQWKDSQHRSKEYDDAPMPWAVFFAPGGVAFHEGNPETTSAGCVRMDSKDAMNFYNELDEYDRVEVH